MTSCFGGWSMYSKVYWDWSENNWPGRIKQACSELSEFHSKSQELDIIAGN